MNKTERIIAMIDMYMNEMKKTIIGILNEEEDKNEPKIDMRLISKRLSNDSPCVTTLVEHVTNDDDVSVLTQSTSTEERRGRKSKTCIHSTDGKMCEECLKNKDRCEHGKNRYACRSCGTGLCEHDKFRNSCKICKPKN